MSFVLLKSDWIAAQMTNGSKAHAVTTIAIPWRS
jgi:hypothetical protein